jgi:hypothetical protein
MRCCQIQRKSKGTTAASTLKTSSTKDVEEATSTQMRYSRCSWAAEWEAEAIVDKDPEDTHSQAEAAAVEGSPSEAFTVYWLKNN